MRPLHCSALFPYTTLFRSFAPARDGRRALLVGGGVGIAPLAIWQDQLGADVGAPGSAPSWSCQMARGAMRSEEHTSELQSRQYLVCRLLLEKKKTNT